MPPQDRRLSRRAAGMVEYAPVRQGESLMQNVARVVGLGHSDPLFARIRMEAQEAVKRDPALAGFLMTAILNHVTLDHAVAHRVAERLSHPDLPAALVRQEYDAL